VYDNHACLTRLLQGAFAECFEVKPTSETADRQRYCAKVMQKPTGDQLQQNAVSIDKIQAEVLIHREVKHPNIVKFIEVFENDTSIVIIMELCSRGVSNEDMVL
jgi:serine/threonine protein kinase